MSFTQQNVRSVVFHTADSFTAAGGIAHGFASRLGGVSGGCCASLNLGLHRDDTPEAVRENYTRFCEALGTSRDRIVMTHQVHQDEIRTVSEADILPDLFAPFPYDADGLITDRPGFCLTIFYADCIPVLLYDPVRRVIAAVHSGWRGTALGIAPKAARMMAEHYGSRAEDILCAVGPGIGPCCFETHADVPDAMREAWGSLAEPFLRPAEIPGKFHVDLKGIIGAQMLQAGLLPEHIDTLPLCTGCRPDLYWSHRKLGTRRGNQAAMIQLLPAD